MEDKGKEESKHFEENSFSYPEGLEPLSFTISVCDPIDESGLIKHTVYAVKVKNFFVLIYWKIGIG